jgi:hypothetical protein
MSAPVDREQLRRDCSDALEAHLRDQRVDRIAELADALRALGAEVPGGRTRLGSKGDKMITYYVAPRKGAGAADEVPEVSCYALPGGARCPGQVR